jgi:hypothetical protein
MLVQWQTQFFFGGGQYLPGASLEGGVGENTPNRQIFGKLLSRRRLEIAFIVGKNGMG